MVRRGRFALLVRLRGGMLGGVSCFATCAVPWVLCWFASVFLRNAVTRLRRFLFGVSAFARRYGMGLRITGIPQGYVVRESLVLPFKGELLRVGQVGFAVAPHVVERAVSLSEVKAGGHGAAYEAFRAADGLLDGVALRKAAGDGA